jgi:outer membrane protein assembly factor BamB
VLGQRLIIEAGHVLALNKKTGEMIWKSRTGYRPGYGSPAVLDHDGRILIAVLNNDGVSIVAASDGKEIAFYEWKTSFATNSTTPLISGDQVFISTGYNRGCTLLRFDGSSLEAVYENKVLRNHFNNSVLWKGHLYGVDGNSHNARVCQIVCMDLRTGQERWGHREFGCGSVMIADGKLLIFSDSGELVLARLNAKEYEEVSRFRVLEGRCWTVPVLAGGRVYCRNAAGDMACVDVNN